MISLFIFDILFALFLMSMTIYYQLNKEKEKLSKQNKILETVDNVAKNQGVFGGWTHTAIRMALEELFNED